MNLLELQQEITIASADAIANVVSTKIKAYEEANKPPDQNKIPIISVGEDRIITLPFNSVVVTATASDVDGSIQSYKWGLVSGNPIRFSNDTARQPTISGLTVGDYIIKCTVTDDKGATAEDTLTITVRPEVVLNKPPVANAGDDLTITLPENKILLKGSGTDTDGTIKSYLWNKRSGPAATIVNPNAAQTEVTGLTEGSYIFALRVMDDKGDFSIEDPINVTVKPAVIITPPVTVIPERIVKGQTVVISGEHIISKKTIIEEGGKLVFDPAKNTAVRIKNVNLINMGKLELKPANKDITHYIKFEDVNENTYVGGTMHPVDTDPGLWVMAGGQNEFIGAPKTSWTRTTEGVLKGATSFTLQDVTGWNVGDKIVIVPTDTPTGHIKDYTDRPIDYFAQKFERRIIKTIEGNKVTFDTPLVYEHLAYTSEVTGKHGTSKRFWTPEVYNLTRNVKVSGTESGRVHIFHSGHGEVVAGKTVHHNQLNLYKHVEGFNLGPRNGAGRPRGVLGRYALHFHHTGWGAKGTLVEGCAFYDIGTRCYVPHVAHGVTFRNNIAHRVMQEAFWWDDSDASHEILYEGNIFDHVNNGVQEQSGMALTLGDLNVARNNVAVYAHLGDNHGDGGFAWRPNSQGIWVFENNLAHSCGSGVFIWDNGSENHVLRNYDSYNCQYASFQGAYANNWTFFGGHHFNSPIHIKASSSNSFGAVYKDIFLDMDNKHDYPIVVHGSQIQGSENNANKIIHATMRRYNKNAVLHIEMNENIKWVDLIDCDFDKGKGHDITQNGAIANGWTARVQNGDRALMIQRVNGVDVEKTIPPFAPKRWDEGTGLKGEYFKGKAFNTPIFTRLDPSLVFQNWSSGVHHQIPAGTPWSARWTGKVIPQYTGAHNIRIDASGGFRLWVGGKLLLDRWTETEHRPEQSTATVDLIEGQAADIKIEQYHEFGKHGGMQLFWKHPAMKYEGVIPQSQLFLP